MASELLIGSLVVEGSQGKPCIASVWMRTDRFYMLIDNGNGTSGYWYIAISHPNYMGLVSAALLAMKEGYSVGHDPTIVLTDAGQSPATTQAVTKETHPNDV